MSSNKLIVSALAVSLMFFGVAYGAWNHQVNVFSAVSTGSLNGSVSYKSNEERVNIDEDDFNDYYKVNIERVNNNKGLKDTLILANSGTVPSRYMNFKSIDADIYVNVEIITTHEILETPAIEEAPSDEEPPAVEETSSDEDPLVVEETPRDEAPPVVEEAPSDEEPPAVEEQPIDEEPPVVEEAPSDEAPPVVEETPRDEEAPAAEEVKIGIDTSSSIHLSTVAATSTDVADSPVEETVQRVKLKIPEEFLRFEIDNGKGKVHKDLSLKEFCSKLNQLNAETLYSKEQRLFKITESLSISQEERQKLELDLSLAANQRIEIVSYEWEYSYSCRQVAP